MNQIWYIDIEGYKFDYLQFFVKEIAVLSQNSGRCYNYHIKYPCSMIFNPKDLKTAEYQFKRHYLSWEFGEYKFLDAIKDIKFNILDDGGADVIFVKGQEKCDYLKQFFRNVKCLPEQPSFSELNMCLNEVCKYSHGKHCSRRKVFELCHYYKNFFGNKCINTQVELKQN